MVTRGTFGADGAFGNLDDDIRSDGVDAGDVFGGDFLLGFLFALALDFLKAAVQCCGDGIPEVEEGVFIQADIDEHGFEALLDVFHAAFEDAADDVLVAFALDGVFLKQAVLDEGDAAFEFFHIHDDGVALGWVGVADA